MKQKYLWYSDTHLNFAWPWHQYDFISRIKEENSKGLFLTGDIACGLTINQTLRFIAKKLEEIPIYFVLGNHDYYASSFEETHSKVKNVCSSHSNLHWITNNEITHVSDNICIIGEEGWYDGRVGEPIYLSYNFDWIMIDEFRRLNNPEEKLKYSRSLADYSTKNLQNKLIKALQQYKTIYIITHMPPWPETARGVGTELEPFWLPYNINVAMGKMIENVMKDRPNQNVVVLAGHVHSPSIIHVANNIECLVQDGKYLGSPTDHNCLFI